MAPTPTETSPRVRSSYLAAHGLSLADAGIVMVAVVLVVGYFPPLFFDNWTLRMALIALAGLPGLVCVVTAARARHLPSLILTALLGWLLLTSFLGGAARSAVIGDAGRELSWLSVALACGLWGLGRSIGARCGDVLTPIVLAALGFGSIVGIVQTAAGVDTGPLALYFGRPAGLVVNPVYYGALCAAGALIGMAVSRVTWWTVVPMVLCAHGAALSGSRVAFGSTVLLSAAVIASRRTVAAAVLGSTNLVGLISGALLARARTPDIAISSRLTSSDGGGRTLAWRYGLDAWFDRPIQGYGVGRFRAVTQGRFTTEFAGRFAADERTQAWFDPHNVIVNVVVAGGVVALLLVAAWLVTSATDARGPLAWGASAIGLTWLLQPLGLATFPIAMLLFGVSASTGDERSQRPPRRAVIVCVAFGAALGAWLLVADLRIKSAADGLDAGSAVSAARMYPHDPVVADLVAQIAALDDRSTDEVREHWRRLPTEYDPDRPLWWIRLATSRAGRDDLEGAHDALARAAELQPNSVGTVRASLGLAVQERDVSAAEELLARACELEMPECRLSIDPDAIDGVP